MRITKETTLKVLPFIEGYWPVGWDEVVAVGDYVFDIRSRGMANFVTSSQTAEGYKGQDWVLGGYTNYYPYRPSKTRGRLPMNKIFSKPLPLP